MLKFLRHKKVQKRIFILLAVVIIPPFLLWGVIASQKEAKTPSVLGMIDSHKISVREYMASYKAVQHQVMLIYGEQAKQIASYINYKTEAWDRLLLAYHAKKENIKTSDKEVVGWLLRQPAFSKDGRFDAGFYKLYVTNYLRTEPREFEEEIRQLLSIQKIQQRSASVTDFTDEDLKKFYAQKNADRDIAYGVIAWESEKDKISVTEDDLKQIYPLIKNQLKDLKTGEEAGFDEIKDQLKTMLVKEKAVEASLKRMEDLKNKMAGPDDFEKVLAGAGMEIKKIEKLNSVSEVPGIGSPEIVKKTVSGINENEIGRPFTTVNGAALIKVTKQWPIDTIKFDQEKEKFRQEMTEEKKTQAMNLLIEDLRKKLNVNVEAMKQIFSNE